MSVILPKFPWLKDEFLLPKNNFILTPSRSSHYRVGTVSNQSRVFVPYQGQSDGQIVNSKRKTLKRALELGRIQKAHNLSTADLLLQVLEG